MLTTGDLTNAADQNIIRSDLQRQCAGGRLQIGTLAGFRSEQVADFVLECMADIVGTRSYSQARPHEMAARHEQIGERAGDEQAVRVLVEPAVADLGEAEDALDDEERVLDLGPDLRFGPVLRPLFLVDDAVMPVNRLAIFPCRITLSLNPGPPPFPLVRYQRLPYPPRHPPPPRMRRMINNNISAPTVALMIASIMPEPRWMPS